MADISKSEMDRIRIKTKELVQDYLGSEYLVTVTSAKYGYIGKVTLEFVKADSNGVVEPTMAKDFRYMASLYGLEPDDLGARYKNFKGEIFKIVGAKPGNRRYPIIVERVGYSGRYKVTAEEVARVKKLGNGMWEPAS